MGVSSFIYCRFYIFPMEAFYLICDIRADPELAESTAARMLYFSGLCLTIFNIGILADCIPKCVRYIKRNIDGITPLETEDVPLSREDRMKGRRRSSVARAFDIVRGTTERRCSSLATVMGMNTIEDVGRMEHETEEEDESVLLDPHDLQSLRDTMQTLQSRSSPKKMD
jgi:hypothetical protein